MPRYLAALTIVLLVGMVLVRALLMKRQGIRAILFGKIDRKDFLIPPFAFFYFYLVFARALGLPLPSRQEFFRSNAIAWPGIGLCAAGLLLFLAGLLSFGRSFRVGIDAEHPDRLITSGVFAYTRNPIYVAFGLVLVGQFLILLDFAGIYDRGVLAVSPPGTARRGFSAEALRRSICGVLPAGASLLVMGTPWAARKLWFA